MMTYAKAYQVKEEFSAEEFLRELLIYLGTHKDTPMDVVDAQFGEVRKREKEVLLCTSYVKGTCNASVGYDRQEPYIAYEKYQEKIGDRYVTKERPVTKYKTVTDWHPWSGEYKGEATCCVYNSFGKAADDGRAAQALQTMDKSNTVPIEQVAVNPHSLQTAINECTQIVENRELKLPGNHAKDKRCQSDAKVTFLVCYKLPYYEVTYTYNGTEYSAECFACGDLTIKCEHPSIDVNVTEIVKERTKELEQKDKLMWKIFYGSLVAGLIWIVAFRILWPVSIICLILAMRSSKAYRTAYKEHSDKLANDVMKSKVDLLATALQTHGYTPLEQEEIEDLGSYSVEGAAELQNQAIKLIFCWIGAIMLLAV